MEEFPESDDNVKPVQNKDYNLDDDELKAKAVDAAREKVAAAAELSKADLVDMKADLDKQRAGGDGNLVNSDLAPADNTNNNDKSKYSLPPDPTTRVDFPPPTPSSSNANANEPPKFTEPEPDMYQVRPQQMMDQQ